MIFVMEFHIANLVARGFLVGIFLGLPTGPAGFIIIRKAFISGYKEGISAALGCITSDAFYAILVSFGIGFISQFLLRYNTLIRFACGMALIYIAWTTWHDTLREPAHNAIGYVGSFFETLSVSISNPILIVSMTALFSTVGGPGLLSARYEKVFFVIAIILGAALWWGLFLKWVMWLKTENKILSLDAINKFFAVIIAISGIGILGYTLFQVGRVGWEYVDLFRQFLGYIARLF